MWFNTKKDRFDCKEGQFIFGNYKVCIDLDACDRIIKIIWHNKLDFHSTILIKVSVNYIQRRSSVQVNEALVL